MLFRLHRIARGAQSAYPLCVFWLYLGLFVLTFALVFVFPPLGLALVFAGLAGLLLVVTVGKILGIVTRSMARALIDRGICPSCSERRAVPFGDQPCPVCGQAWSSRGCALEPAGVDPAAAAVAN